MKPIYRGIASMLFTFSLNPFDSRVSMRQIIELLFSILIISILVTVAIPIYIDCRLRAKITHYTGADRTNDMYVFHAINGEWPHNNKQLETFQSDMGFNVYHKSDESEYGSLYVKNTSIENGAIHFIYKEELEGKILSLRPATPKMDQTGPVILVCNKEKPGWIIAGSDKTDIDRRLISKFLR